MTVIYYVAALYSIFMKILRGLTFWLLAVALVLASASALAQVCAAPGVGGAQTIAAANTQVNTYYPGAAAGGATAGFTVGYTSASGRGAATAIAAGDLVLIIQMQDGTPLVSANNNTYGFPASTSGIAGRYEFARVASLGVNSLNLTTALSNTYVQNTAVANNQTYQVIRVPQYSTLTINAGASVVPAPWDGTTGGVVVADVSGALVNNGSVNASYAGFRGNAGLSLTGQAGAPAVTVATYDYVRPDAYLADGGKGEGIAGTPNRVLNVFSAAGVLLTLANGTSTNATLASQSIATNAAYLNTTGRSYNGGSRSGGAPANGGGGGEDSAPATNSENSGGGGGGNQGAGGQGGNTWNTNIALGGLGGKASSPSLATRLIMGGGGGSATTNNSSQLDVSGGAGAGIIFLKAGTVAGTGSLLANGQAGRSLPPDVVAGNCPFNATSNCDGAGGAGAGGTIVVLASSGTIAQAQVNGGQGGNVNGRDHGPGGGGGGGLVVTSSSITLSANGILGGIRGQVGVGAGGTPTFYGGTDGAVGAVTTVLNTALPAVSGGLPANCLPALAVSKITSTPAAVTTLVSPITTTYSIVVSNPAGRGDARGVNVYDPILPLGLVSVLNPPAPVATLSSAPSACTLASRTSTVDPANGVTASFTASAWTLPGGCTLTYTFTVQVPSSMPQGTYSNSAVGWFTDPTDSSGSRTVTSALPPAATGLAASTTFTTGGAIGGSNYDGNNAANTAEDIRIQPQARLNITKNDGVATLSAGGTTTYTLTVSNAGPSDSPNALLKDPSAAGLVCQTISCTGVTGAATCPAPTAVTIGLLQGSGIVLNSLPANSSLTFSLVCRVTATGQ